jgi:uncharacterized NAD-dependent epimerase/dehydratase family protein
MICLCLCVKEDKGCVVTQIYQSSIIDMILKAKANSTVETMSWAIFQPMGVTNREWEQILQRNVHYGQTIGGGLDHRSIYNSLNNI